MRISRKNGMRITRTCGWRGRAKATRRFSASTRNCSGSSTTGVPPTASRSARARNPGVYVKALANTVTSHEAFATAVTRRMRKERRG